jgi:hypothetical protein
VFFKSGVAFLEFCLLIKATLSLEACTNCVVLSNSVILLHLSYTPEIILDSIYCRLLLRNILSQLHTPPPHTENERPAEALSMKFKV